MSDVLYPISLIKRLVPTRMERTIVDPFEDGSTSARRTWTAQYFKRHFDVTHSHLTQAEWRYIRSFYSQRNGMYDSFWFRDNVNREGNASVRFAGPLPTEFQQGERILQIGLDQVAAIRALPEWDELTTAAGNAPLLWFDANREIYYSHAGTTVSGEANAYDSMLAYAAPWQGGSSLSLGGSLSQYQYYVFTGTQWAKTSSNISQISTSLPNVSIFCIARHSSSATRQIILSVGAVGTKTARGLSLSAANKYQPYAGTASETGIWGAGTGFTNPIDTWSSVCVTYGQPGAFFDSRVKVYGNAALIDSYDTSLTGYTAGPAALGAAPDGTLISNPSNALTNCNLSHVLLFAAELTLAQIKAIHNLLGYQFGLATV